MPHSLEALQDRIKRGSVTDQTRGERNYECRIMDYSLEWKQAIRRVKATKRPGPTDENDKLRSLNIPKMKCKHLFQ
mgnify:CR=1 FL=1